LFGIDPGDREFGFAIMENKVPLGRLLRKRRFSVEELGSEARRPTDIIAPARPG